MKRIYTHKLLTALALVAMTATSLNAAKPDFGGCRDGRRITFDVSSMPNDSTLMLSKIKIGDSNMKFKVLVIKDGTGAVSYLRNPNNSIFSRKPKNRGASEASEYVRVGSDKKLELNEKGTPKWGMDYYAADPRGLCMKNGEVIILALEKRGEAKAGEPVPTYNAVLKYNDTADDKDFLGGSIPLRFTLDADKLTLSNPVIVDPTKNPNQTKKTQDALDKGGLITITNGKITDDFIKQFSDDLNKKGIKKNFTVLDDKTVYVTTDNQTTLDGIEDATNEKIEDSASLFNNFTMKYLWWFPPLWIFLGFEVWGRLLVAAVGSLFGYRSGW